jgi:hypothetical protein
MKELTFPAWFTGPDGKSAVFESPEDVPNGWTSGAEKQTVGGKAAAPKSAAPVKQPEAADLDADGHAYDAALHAGTGSKTKAGLWRMKVGVAPGRRPVAKPPLDL